MDKNIIAERYATAIYDLSKSIDNLDEVREVLNLLTEKYDEDEDFKEFLHNPTITFEEKENFLKKFFSFISKDALKIVDYMIDKERSDYIPLIKERFLEKYYKGNNKLPVIGIFTKELSEEQKKKLEEKLEKKYGKKVVLSLRVDKNIIGGGIIKIGSDVINGSIKHQIEDMKRMF